MKTLIKNIQQFILGIFKETPIFWKWIRNTAGAFLLWLHTEGEALKDILINIKIPHFFGFTAYHVTVAAGAALVVAAQSQANPPVVASSLTPTNPV